MAFGGDLRPIVGGTPAAGVPSLSLAGLDEEQQ